MSQKIAFIGAGNMAEAIISGMISKEIYRPDQIYVTNRSNKDRLSDLKNTYGINVSENKQEILKKVDTIILAIKPKDVASTLESMKDYIQKEHLIISVLAGVSTTNILELVDLDVAIIRAMPNTSATIGKSATALCKGKFAREQHMEEAVSLLQSVGTVSIVQEKDLHAVTGLSGSGPAYIYYLVESMEKAAIDLGLEKEVAKNLVAQTIIGAGEMLKHSPKDASTLRKDVMSPGGTTEAGLKVLEEHKVQEAMIHCIKRAAQRSNELGEELSNIMIKSK